MHAVRFLLWTHMRNQFSYSNKKLKELTDTIAARLQTLHAYDRMLFGAQELPKFDSKVLQKPVSRPSKLKLPPPEMVVQIEAVSEPVKKVTLVANTQPLPAEKTQEEPVEVGLEQGRSKSIPKEVRAPQKSSRSVMKTKKGKDKAKSPPKKQKSTKAL